ncbi:MAG: hypothetical protein V3U46_10000 [Acidimicrobiia bacterium]
MAQYLIIHEDGAIDFAEAKNIKGAATANLLNEETAMIYRLAGPGKEVTARVEQRRLIEVGDADEEE